jgi:hypothetical protein
VEFLQYVDIINKVTVPVVLVAILWAIKEKWIVPGWIFSACEERSNRLEGLLNQHAAKLEVKLDALESEERKRWTGKHESP